LFVCIDANVDQEMLCHERVGSWMVVKLTLFVCVWRWSCDSLHGSKWWYRRGWGCPDNRV